MTSGNQNEDLGRGVTNLSIDAVLRGTCPDFQGVFSSDTLPSHLSHPSSAGRQFSLVCNLSEAAQPGSHWVSIIVFRNFALYLDSLGFPCTNPLIADFLRNLEKPTFYNTRQVQDATSDFCGLYCILFVLHFTLRDLVDADPPRVSFRWEKSQLLRNDLICADRIKEILNKMSRKVYLWVSGGYWLFH